MYECKECGYKISNEDQGTMCPVCNKPMSPIEEVKEIKVKEKKPFSFKNIAITFLAILVGRFAGSCMAEDMIKNNRTNSVEKEMNAYIEKVEKYPAGEMTADGYESEYWNIDFTADEKWIEMEESEKIQIERELTTMGREAALRTIRSEIQTEEQDEDLLEKYKNTLKYNLEAGYNCVSDDGIIIGELLFTTYSAYGLDLASNQEEEFINGLKTELKDSVSGTVYLGNEKYHYIDGIVQAEGVEVNVRIYIRVKGVMVNMIRLTYLDGEEGLIESFESRMSEYN